MKKTILCALASALLFAGCSKNEINSSDLKLPQQALATMKSDSLGGAAAALAVQGITEINASTVQKTIKGFGGANIVAWPGDLTSAERNTAFSPRNGIGLSIVRVPNSSSEFTAEKATIDTYKSFGGSAISSPSQHLHQ